MADYTLVGMDLGPGPDITTPFMDAFGDDVRLEFERLVAILPIPNKKPATVIPFSRTPSSINYEVPQCLPAICRKNSSGA